MEDWSLEKFHVDQQDENGEIRYALDTSRGIGSVSDILLPLTDTLRRLRRKSVLPVPPAFQ